jgi:cell division protein FtsB
MTRLLRQLGVLTVFVLAGFYVFAMMAGPNGWPAMMQKREQLIEAERKNEELRQQISREEATIRELREGGPARDRVIRDKTRKQKPRETTIYFTDPPSGSKH